MKMAYLLIFLAVGVSCLFASGRWLMGVEIGKEGNHNGDNVINYLNLI